MHFFNLLNAVLFISTADALSIRDDYVLHERRHITPSPWIKRSQAPRDVILPVRIAIESRNIERGHEFLMDISDPTSPNFGKHWTPKEVHDTFAPAQETVRAVREWLSSSGIAAHRHTVAVGRGQILFKASVDEVESLLGTQYDVWEHDETGALSIACDEYHVPQPIKHIISFITPTIGITAPRSSNYSRRGVQKETNRQGRPLLLRANDNPATNLSNCQDRITPACVKALYQVPPGNSAQAGNELGIYEFGDDYDQGDLNLFFANFSPNIPNGTSPILQSIDGGSAPVPIQDGGGESALDLQLSYPLIYPQNIKVFQTMDDFTADNTYGIFNPFLDALDASYCTFDGGDDPQIDPHFPDGHGWNHSEQCGVYKPTHVISLSAEIAEAAYPPAYAIRQCHEYLKLGLLGTSIIFSSGDNGTVSQFGVLGCLANDSQNPGFPSSCPYVTSVGATQIKPGATVSDPEIAVLPGGGTLPDGIDPFTSGGGFSNVFSRPSYQKSAVTSYLHIDTAQLPPSSTYNSTGRAFPDVSANGWNIAVYLQGFSFRLWGTSASAPIFASVINRLNEERLAAGKGPVGFLNPILYSNPDMFNDITEGYNWGCNAAIAFYAQKGWDPVTGLGTPNYPKMRKVFLELP